MKTATIIAMIFLPTAIFAIMIAVTINPQLNPPIAKNDGWIISSEGNKTHVGHDNAVGLCMTAEKECRELVLGCGAVNCECPKMTKGDVDDFFRKNSCAWIMGEGTICKPQE